MQNILYARVQNPIEIVVDGVPCNQLLLKTDNGNVTQGGVSKTSCIYTIVPDSSETATLIVFKKKKTGLIQVGEMVFRVKSLPPPTAEIGVSGKNSYSKKMLIAMGGVRAFQTGGYICADFSVESYTATIVRNNSLIDSIHNSGAVYNAALIACLQKLKAKDQLIISDIMIRYFDNKSLLLQEKLLYTVVE